MAVELSTVKPRSLSVLDVPFKIDRFILCNRKVLIKRSHVSCLTIPCSRVRS